MVWAAAICGCAVKLASTPYSVSKTASEKLRVTSAVVQTGSMEAGSACGMKVTVVRSSARTIAGAASAAVEASVALNKSRRFIAGISLLGAFRAGRAYASSL